MSASLKFNGIDMPVPKQNGFKITKNKIWSANTKRNDNGGMVGTIIAIKRKIEIEWAVLTPEQVKRIDDVVSDASMPFTSISYRDEQGGTTEMTAYFGDPTYPIYSLNVNGKQLLTGVKVNGIEQ